MARYLSKYSAFKKTVRKAQQTLVQTVNGPQLELVREPIIAYFQQAIVTAEEREKAGRQFGFLGVADGETEPNRRISGYDTEEQAKLNLWDAATHQEVVRMLDKDTGPDYFRVEQTRLEKPWPLYDDLEATGRRTNVMVAEKIVQTVEMLGLNPETIIAYEKENRNRAEVIEALQPAPVPVEDETILVQA